MNDSMVYMVKDQSVPNFIMFHSIINDSRCIFIISSTQTLNNSLSSLIMNVNYSNTDAHRLNTDCEYFEQTYGTSSCQVQEETMRTSFVHLPGYLMRFIVESNGTKYASPSGNAIYNV